MSYTTLRVNEQGVLLFAQHEERFRHEGEESVNAFRLFAAEAVPGIYNLTWENHMIVKPRGESRHFDGMSVRFMVSPLANSKHPIEKPMPPNIYSKLIEPEIATLLTSADGTEIFESCSASVIAWNGEHLIMVPSDRPRVKSTMENMLKGMKGVLEEPILRDSDYPIALINAIKPVCTVLMEERKTFPSLQLEMIKEWYFASSRR